MIIIFVTFRSSSIFPLVGCESPDVQRGPSPECGFAIPLLLPTELLGCRSREQGAQGNLAL